MPTCFMVAAIIALKDRSTMVYPPGNYVLRVWEETQFGRPRGHGVQSRRAMLR